MEGYDATTMDLNLKATELTLGLPGADKPVRNNNNNNNNKRSLPETPSECGSENIHAPPPPTKSQIVGWPPVRSYRKNNIQKSTEGSGIYVKVSMDGAPYLRKIDLKVYQGYSDLLKALENMFKFTVGPYSEREGYKGSDYAPTYEDKDGDWMLLGDVPWDMFISSCNKLRIMKGSEAKGLTCAV